MGSDPTRLAGGVGAGAEVVGQRSDQTAFEETFLDDKLAQLLCERYEASKAEIHQGEEWTGAIADFIPFIDAYARDDDHEDLARGLLARLFEFSYRLNASEGRSIQEFTVGVFDVLSQLRHVPDSLMRPHAKAGLSKRQPSFFESMRGTIRRYEFMERLPGLFDRMADGIIVGGSMGYGPFFSVRDGGHHDDSSDVDAIIVVEEGLLGETDEPLIEPTEGLYDEAVALFLRRLAVFGTMRDEDEADIISQRFDLPGYNFNMSAHFMPRDFFERMNGAQLARELETREDALLVVRDYKPARFEHPVCAQKSFDGSTFEYTVPDQMPAEDGFLARIPGYIIDDGKFYPGLYQNLISPEFEVLHDRNGFTSGLVDDFRRTVLRYIDEERQQGHIASVNLSHIRNAFFAPGRYRQRLKLSIPDER